MRATGMVRKIDELGRIVIPMEVRRTLDITAHTPIEMYLDGENIVLKKYMHDRSCVFCGQDETKLLFRYKDKYICSSCRNDIK